MSQIATSSFGASEPAGDWLIFEGWEILRSQIVTLKTYPMRRLDRLNIDLLHLHRIVTAVRVEVNLQFTSV